MFPQNYPFYEFLVHNLSSLQQVTPDSTSFVNCMEQPPQPQGGAGGQPLQPQEGAGEDSSLRKYPFTRDGFSRTDDDEMAEISKGATNVNLLNRVTGIYASPESPAGILAPEGPLPVAPHVALPASAALQNDGFQTPPPLGGAGGPPPSHVDTPFPDQLAVQFASMSTT
jgi:hypothetical protein